MLSCILCRYKLGPNGAIMTALNLFATKFDQVLELLEKRSNQVDIILVDTPGQIEAFNWSASGSIILGNMRDMSIIHHVLSMSPTYKCHVLRSSRLCFLFYFALGSINCYSLPTVSPVVCHSKSWSSAYRFVSCQFPDNRALCSWYSALPEPYHLHVEHDLRM